MFRWLTVVAIAGMIAVNGLANALPIGGKTTGEISDGFNILFTPAGYVFSIWGLIYLLLAGFAVTQALGARKDDPVLRGVRPWVLLNAAANASWIVAWHNGLFPLTLLVMVVILASLVMIYRKLPSARGGVVDELLVRTPFALYLGWISIATIANLTVVLWDAGFSEALASPAVTLAIVAAATVICAVVSTRNADPVYAAVFVWAFIGIALDNRTVPLLFWGCLLLAAVCGVFVGTAAVAALRRARVPS